jgi:diacylglycerol kinase family enzyme
MKKIASIAFGLMLLVTMSGCGSNTQTNDVTSVEKNKATDYISLTVAAAQDLAEKNNVPFRVVTIDGEPQMATMDFVIGRINASTQDGMVVSYQVEGQENPALSYDANSWKTVIAKSCSSFFDGCNNCRRAGNTDIAACTRKACAEYEEPKCMDEDVVETETQ